MTKITLEGLRGLEAPEDRSLADVNVYYNNQIYKWQIYIPKEVNDLGAYLESRLPFITADIDSKEAKWAALNPKTRIISDPSGDIIVDISKNEIVCPDIPDYYALRRIEYPSITDQLGAIFKGVNSTEFADMLTKIQAVKDKYPNPNTI